MRMANFSICEMFSAYPCDREKVKIIVRSEKNIVVIEIEKEKLLSALMGKNEQECYYDAR